VFEALTAIDDYALLFLVAAAFALAINVWGKRSKLIRASAAAVCVILLIRYGMWRITDTLPRGQGLAGEIWALIFLVLECLNLVRLILTQGLMGRTRDRGIEVDARANSRMLAEPVDVFITTSDDNLDIVERALIGACAIRHPDLRVWLIDAGARDWARALAEQHSVHYLPGTQGDGTRACDLNDALAAAHATGRRPSFMLLLNARFVPGRDILSRTLPLFEDGRVGIVQTPQNVFNPDPLQVNLLSPSAWPDEQNFFFNVLLPSLDAWDGAICCGTSAVFRISALEDSGGIATGTPADEMMTSLKLGARGWRTIYLNEPLSLGLAPEGVDAYVTQRGRWCIAAIQQLATSLSFFGSGKLRLIDRISNLTAVLTWTAGFPFRLMLLAAPIVWYLTGVSVIDATIDDLARELGPALALTTLFMVVYGGRRFLPFLSDATKLASGFVVLRATRLVAARPKPAAGAARADPGVTVLWSWIAPLVTILIVTIVAMAFGLTNHRSPSAERETPLYIIWTLFNIVLLLMACAACINMPRRRRDQRFPSGEQAVVAAPSMPQTLCTVVDISVGGASLFVTHGWRTPPREGILRLDGGALRVPFVLASVANETIRIRFTPSEEVRHALILKLFDTRYAEEIERPSLVQVLFEVVLGAIA
jgi:cellulose synthase (UDP-forming)